MSLYQFVVNRYVIPVIEGHKAEGREEGRVEGRVREEGRGRKAESRVWPKLGPSGKRGTSAASPPSVKDGSSSSRTPQG